MVGLFQNQTKAAMKVHMYESILIFDKTLCKSHNLIRGAGSPTILFVGVADQDDNNNGFNLAVATK